MDLIPLSLYTAFFYHVILCVVLLTLAHGLFYDLYAQQSIKFAQFAGWFLLIFVTWYMGTRPISSQYFADMGAYAETYIRAQRGAEIVVQHDFLFNYFLLFCTKIMSVSEFFLLVDIIYVLPMFLFARKYSPGYWYYIFLIFMCTMSFWSYGTNGIRNGIATSLFLLALVFYDRKVIVYTIMALCFGIHNSMIIPIAAFLVAAQWKNPKLYMGIWLGAIPLSLVMGSFWESLFMSLGFDDQRVTGYLSGQDDSQGFRYSGFRWDFLFYSSFAVFAGWYFIFKKKIEDKFYTHLFGTYMIANAFWILVIRANFSNRFAYLSWFMMGAVIAYPMLKYKMWPDQHKILTITIFIYFMFTYLLYFR